VPRVDLGTAVRFSVAPGGQPVPLGCTGTRQVEGVVIEVVPKGREPSAIGALRTSSLARSPRYVVFTWGGLYLLRNREFEVVAW
jgi:hypothetical protein